MADDFTTSNMFRAAEAKPADEPTRDESYVFEPAFADRARSGNLSEADDRARVQGWLGGTRDAVELSDKVRAATGGHDPVWPLTTPQPPADPAEHPLHPSLTYTPELIRQVDRERALKAHQEARQASSDYEAVRERQASEQATETPVE